MKTTAEPTPGLSHSARNQAQPAAARSGPTAFAGRLPQKTRPQARSAQPAPSRATAPPSDEPANENAGPSRARASETAPSASPAGQRASRSSMCQSSHSAQRNACRAAPCIRTRASPMLCRPRVEGAPRCARSSAAVASKAPTSGGARRCRRDDSSGGRLAAVLAAAAIVLAACSGSETDKAGGADEVEPRSADDGGPERRARPDVRVRGGGEPTLRRNSRDHVQRQMAAGGTDVRGRHARGREGRQGRHGMGRRPRLRHRRGYELPGAPGPAADRQL